MRRILAALLIFALAGPAPGSPRRHVEDGEGQAIAARPLAIEGAAPASPALKLVEAWSLDSPNARFGGLSALALTSPRRFLIVSDQGMMVRFTLPPRGGPLRDARIGPITGMPVQARKARSDSEGLFHDPVTAQSWVSFEITPRILRIDERRGAITGRAMPAAMTRWPENRGPEAITRLADGRFLVFSEGADSDPRGFEALLFTGDPTAKGVIAQRLFYDTGNRGQVTDAAALPDGRVLLLHRRVNWWGFVRGRGAYVSTIAIADPAGLKRGAVLRGRTLLELGPPAISDNFEGLAVARDVGGGYSLWLVSDDNFNGWQDNVLLRFRLDLSKLPRAPGE